MICKPGSHKTVWKRKSKEKCEGMGKCVNDWEKQCKGEGMAGKKRSVGVRGGCRSVGLAAVKGLACQLKYSLVRQNNIIAMCAANETFPIALYSTSCNAVHCIGKSKQDNQKLTV